MIDVFRVLEEHLHRQHSILLTPPQILLILEKHQQLVEDKNLAIRENWQLRAQDHSKRGD